MEAMVFIEEDDKLSEMIREFLESDSYNKNSFDQLHQLRDEVIDDHLLYLKEILEDVSEAETEILGKIESYCGEAKIKMEPKELRKWIVSRLRMHGYDASLCKTFWVKTSAHSSSSSAFRFTGDYEYIDVMMKSSESEELRLIVDTDFRSQFEVARPTEAYKELSKILPCIFVGTEHRLETLISILCAAAKQSLKESGLHVPPWRKASYMQSKWLSQNCKRIIPFSPLCTL